MEGARVHHQPAVAGVPSKRSARAFGSCRLCGRPMFSNSKQIRQSHGFQMFHVSNRQSPRQISTSFGVFRSRPRSLFNSFVQIVPRCSGSALHQAAETKIYQARRNLCGRPVEMIGLEMMVDGISIPSVKFRRVGLVTAIHASASRAAETESRSVKSAASEISMAPNEGRLLTQGLPLGLQPHLMPRHVAIIMDGNARWAKRRGLLMNMGHAAGAESLWQAVQTASKWGIEVLTVFAFSTENWRRPQAEVDFLMQMFASQLYSEMDNVLRSNLQVRPVGNISALPPNIRQALEYVKETSRQNTGMVVNFCVNYSGRADVIQACRTLAARVANGSMSPADIDEEALAREMALSELGELRYPDLVIRTSGEHRISNFLLWQAAYSEFVFLDTLWPDFGEEEFKTAVVKFQERDRRFGKRNRSIWTTLLKLFCKLKPSR